MSTPCQRCAGLLVPVASVAYFDSHHEEPATSATWKCVNCGNWLDPVIVRNRARSTALVPAEVA